MRDWGGFDEIQWSGELPPRQKEDHMSTLESEIYTRTRRMLIGDGWSRVLESSSSTSELWVHPSGRTARLNRPELPDRRSVPWPDALVAAAQTLMVLAMVPLAASPVPPPLAGSLPTTLALLAMAPALRALGARVGAACCLLAGIGWGWLALRGLADL